MFNTLKINTTIIIILKMAKTQVHNNSYTFLKKKTPILYNRLESLFKKIKKD